MQPDTNLPPQNLEPVQALPPSPVVPPQPKKSKRGLIVVLLLVIVLGAAGVGVFLLMNSRNTKDKALQSSQESLEATQKELSTTKTKLNELDSPQKKANDTKRKNDLSRFLAVVNEYAANNNGKFPTTEPSFFAKDFEAKYITGKLQDFTDPNTKQAYKFTPVAPVQTPPGVTLGTIQYQWPAKCQGSEFEDVTNTRQAAARLILESGEIYCVNA